MKDEGSELNLLHGEKWGKSTGDIYRPLTHRNHLDYFFLNISENHLQYRTGYIKTYRKKIKANDRPRMST